jgi:ketosteroid isomerase-like protein
MGPASEQALAAIGPSGVDRRPLGERAAATPRLACEAFCRAVNSGDLEAAIACLAPDVCLVWADGTAIQGEAAIRNRLQELIACAAWIESELAGVLVAGELALAHERWQISYDRRPDPASAKAPAPTLALRLIAGEWKVAIAAPWGVPASEPLRAIRP